MATKVEEVTSLLGALELIHTDSNTSNRWTNDSEIHHIMILTPDSNYIWLFKNIPKTSFAPNGMPTDEFPTNKTEDKFDAFVYVRDASKFITLSACLRQYGLIGEGVPPYQFLTMEGKLIDNIDEAPKQSVVVIPVTSSK